MVEQADVIEQSSSSQDVSGQSSSPAGVTEPSQSSQSVNPEAADSQPGNEILADGIPKDEHNLPLSRVEEIRQQYEKRIAELESQIGDRGDESFEEEPEAPTRPQEPEEHPLLTDLKRQYPNESDRLAAETFAKPFINHIQKLENMVHQAQANVEGIAKVTSAEWEKGIRNKFPELNEKGKEADANRFKFGALRTTFDKLGYSDPDKAAYEVIFKDRVAAKQTQESQEKQKHLTQLKKNAVTVGGATGTPAEGRAPVPMREGKEWNAFLEDSVKRAFRST